MPSNLLAVDNAFPVLSREQSVDEKFQQVTSYLYMLRQQLQYSMANLDKENFNETGLAEIGGLITEPVYVQLKNVEGDVTALQVTAGALTSRMEDAEGNLSSLRQTVEGMELKVTNGESSSTIKLFANGASISSQRITFTGMVTFSDLEGSGTTTINGDNITSGTITGCVFQSLLKGGVTSGEIRMCYLNSGNVAGGIRLDDAGAGSAGESTYRMFIYTEKVSGIAFCLKLKSAGNMSVESDKGIYMQAENTLQLAGNTVELWGKVKINGTPLEDLLDGGGSDEEDEE